MVFIVVADMFNAEPLPRLLNTVFFGDADK
jgi:hypothetical protein